VKIEIFWLCFDLSEYLVTKFMLKYNIKPWGVFHPVAVGVCYCGLYLVYLEIDANCLCFYLGYQKNLGLGQLALKMYAFSA
jgi:hypothetical protein